MKNITKTFIVLLGIISFSCTTDDVEGRPVVIPTDAPVLSAPDAGSSYVLNVENASMQAERFVWSSANFDEPVAITYTVELDKEGNDFAAPQTLGTVIGGNQLSVSVESLNGAAIAAGGEAFMEETYEVRIKASLNSTFEPMYSNVVSILITPYVTYPYTDLYLVGSATATGWDNSASANMYPMFRDGTDPKIYHYTGYFAAGQFKAVEVKGQWAPQYGTDGSSIVRRATEADPDPSPFDIATEGYYTIMFNLNDNSFSITPYDESGAATYPTIGIIGTATPGGWDSDTDMTQSTFDPHIWYADNVLLTAGGEMKFRANDGWDVNWGGPTSYSGIGTSGGPNIPIGISSNGTYDVWFNDLTGRYIYIPQN